MGCLNPWLSTALKESLKKTIDCGRQTLWGLVVRVQQCNLGCVNLLKPSLLLVLLQSHVVSVWQLEFFQLTEPTHWKDSVQRRVCNSLHRIFDHFHPFPAISNICFAEFEESVLVSNSYRSELRNIWQRIDQRMGFLRNPRIKVR